MADIRQRNNVANYINVGTADKSDYAFMGAGFTQLDENPTAQTSSKRYINDKAATKRISGYDWSAPFNTDMIMSEKAVAYIVNIGELQLVGSDCETDYIIVDLDSANSGGKYRARKFKVAVEVASFTATDGDMTCTGNLQGMGDPIEGEVSISAGTVEFTPTSAAAAAE